MNQIEQHDGANVRIVTPRYELKSLGAPFRVTLIDSVGLSVDPDTGNEVVTIPDLAGLISAVVRKRVTCPRKLSGEELRFLRKALAVKAKSIAKFLEVSAEHYSRCEAGEKVLTSSNERMFRLFAFIATDYTDPQDFLERLDDEDEPKKKRGIKPIELDDFVRKFLGMRIQSVFDANSVLHFEFFRQATIVDGLPENDEGWLLTDSKAA